MRLGHRAVDGRTTGKALANVAARSCRRPGQRYQHTTERAHRSGGQVETAARLHRCVAARVPSLINSRKRSLYRIVRERQQLADALARYQARSGWSEEQGANARRHRQRRRTRTMLRAGPNSDGRRALSAISTTPRRQHSEARMHCCARAGLLRLSIGNRSLRNRCSRWSDGSMVIIAEQEDRG
jgi:hypothetical protein